MFVGVDGCKAGWFAITLRDNSWRSNIYSNIGMLWGVHRDADLILIDVPIGLPEVNQRACDVEAAQMLGERRSSVFPVPVRAAVYASAYAQATEINRNITGKGLSRQVWEIVPKIREVDALLRTDVLARDQFREVHPEVLFLGLSGHPMKHAKKTANGLEERITLLERFQPNARAIIEDARKSFSRRQLEVDDIVDALVAAVVAQMGNLQSLPERPELDARGLPMQMVYTHGNRLVRLHHAQITIPKGAEDQAKAFYCGLLGLQEIPKPESLQGRGGFWVGLGDVQIHVGTEDGVDRRATKAHLAYQVDNVEYWLDLLQKNGLEIGDSVPIPGFKRFEFRDPFGNRVEFIQPEH